MEQVEFQNQINRMKDCYGEKAYPDERVKLIWKNVGHFQLSWFQNLVDSLIATAKFAPLPVEFFQAAAVERERIWQIEKQEHERESKQAASTYGADDIASICQAIVARVRGQLNDQDFSSFHRMIGTVGRERGCVRCDDGGYVFLQQRSFEYVYRCYCTEGARKPRSIPQVRYEQAPRARSFAARSVASEVDA